MHPVPTTTLSAEDEAKIRALVKGALSSKDAEVDSAWEAIGALGETNPLFQQIVAAIERQTSAESAVFSASAAAIKEETAAGGLAQKRKEAANEKANRVPSDPSAPATFFPTEEAACLGWVTGNLGDAADVVIAPPGTFLGAGNPAIALFKDDHRTNVIEGVVAYAEKHEGAPVNIKGLLDRIRTGTPMVISHGSAKLDNHTKGILIHEYAHLALGDEHETYAVFEFEVRKVSELVGDGAAWVKQRTIDYYAAQGKMWDQDGLPALTAALDPLLSESDRARWRELIKK